MAEKSRIPIPEEIAAEIMFLADRRCCVCNTEKAAQIHHIDENPSNNLIDNLAPLCFGCHNDTMLKGGFSRHLNAAQVRLYRADWLARVKNRRDKISAIEEPVKLIQINDEVYPVSVRENGGDIFIRFSNGEENRLVQTGNDSNPVFHQRSKRVVFLRETENGREIYCYDISLGTVESLVTPNYGDKREEHLSNLSNLHFSPDGRFLYFASSAWTTSGSIHRYDFDTREEMFISAGNSLEVIKYGKYKGHLVASKHKYYQGGGSYDDYWLLTPDGKEIRDLGDALDGVQNFLSHSMAF